MTTLTERLEAATEGSRELDAEIANEYGGLTGMGYEAWEAAEAHAPHYTTSLDAALTLLLPGFVPGLDPRFFEGTDEIGYVRYDAIICKAHWEKWTPVDSDWIERVEARGATPALATAIAALKARGQ